MVTAMILNGQNLERREVMDSLELCWKNAQETMQALQKQHGEEMEFVGIACLVQKDGDPA